MAQFTPLFPMISSLVSSTFSLASDTDLEKNMSDVWTVLLFVTQQYCTLSLCTDSLSLISPCRRETLRFFSLCGPSQRKRECVLCCVFVCFGGVSALLRTWHSEILSELHYGILWCLNQSFFTLNPLCLWINTKTWHRSWYVSNLLNF